MKKTSSLLCILFLFLCGAAVQAHAAKRALVVAVNEYRDPKIVDLEGCVNDGNGIVKILKEHLGFDAREIKFLKNAEATRFAILQAFDEWLVKGTRPGDKIFFFYGGHGSYFWDLNGDEGDEQPEPCDETLCPYDTDLTLNDNGRKRNMIIDDEIAERMRQLKGRTIVTIFDSCHSGTVTRSLGASPMTVRSLSVPLPPHPNSTARGLSRGCGGGEMRTGLHSRKSAKNARVYGLSEEIDASKSYMAVLSAASPVQKAYEMRAGNEKHGALSYSIIQSFNTHPEAVCLFSIRKTYYDIQKRHRLPDQDPQIEGNPGLAQRSLRDIFNASLVSDIAHAAENPHKDMTLSLWANQKGKTRFEQFDAVRFHTRSSDDGYLYLFDLMEPSGKMYLIYPNQWSLARDGSKSNHVEKNREILIPPTRSKGKPVNFRFTADQRGKETIIAMVTQTPWKDMDRAIGENKGPAKLMNEAQKLKILELLHEKQSQRHAEYDEAASFPNDWVGTSLGIEIH